MVYRLRKFIENFCISLKSIQKVALKCEKNCFENLIMFWNSWIKF